MKNNIYTYLSLAVVSLMLVVASAFLMTAADAPIREAGGYLPLIFGAVFTWAAAKALLMERRREQDRNKTVSVDFTRKVRSAA